MSENENIIGMQNLSNLIGLYSSYALVFACFSTIGMIILLYFNISQNNKPKNKKIIRITRIIMIFIFSFSISIVFSQAIGMYGVQKIIKDYNETLT